MPAPMRPDRSRPAVSGPVSRTSAIARPAGIIDSAPNRSSDARVCIESTTPTARPDTAISGAERSTELVELANGLPKLERGNEHLAGSFQGEMSRPSLEPWSEMKARVSKAADAHRAMLHGRRAARRPLPAVLDLVLLHLAVERRPVEAEDLRRLLLVPVGALQRLEDRHLLDLGQRAVRRDHELGSSWRSRFASDSGRSLTVISVPFATSTPRSIAFSSSRTLPGQRWRISR